MQIPTTAEITIIGAGAAGLMAAIWAGRSQPTAQTIVLDGARMLGAKILVAGGGRCNVTHDVVEAGAYAGGSRNAIRKILQRLDVPQTVAFFRELGVELKREETGKLFPTTDDARTVLQALLQAVHLAHVPIYHPCRVETIQKNAAGFIVSGTWGTIRSRSVIMATGGQSLPKSGSDGYGYTLVRALGHSVIPRFPALVPLTLPVDHFVRTLSGLTLPTTLTLRLGSGKPVVSFTDSTLCTHFGLSGPAVLDISRYFLDAQLADPQATLSINWWPGQARDELDRQLQTLGRTTLLAYLRQSLPERLVRALCTAAGVEPTLPAHQLTREARKALVQTITDLPLPITGHRGWNVAEVTAGGVPLSEINLQTMESRVCPGLYLCGEICDVDGRIGGYNFQWAWASGYVAGVAAGTSG